MLLFHVIVIKCYYYIKMLSNVIIKIYFFPR